MTYGADQTLTTLLIPTATTEAATNVEGTRAELHATVNANGRETTYHFEYGTTTAYGSNKPFEPESMGAGTVALSVEQIAAELVPNTTYHYRVVATSDAGTAVGSDQIFSTGEHSTSEEPDEPWQGVGGGAGTGGVYTRAVEGKKLPEDFFLGIQFGGNNEEDITERNAINHYGAKMLRYNFGPHVAGEDPNATVKSYEKLFELYAQKYITILPDLYGAPPPYGARYPDTEARREEWRRLTEKLIEAYGPGGTFWNTHAVPYEPAIWWEVWNEPNRGANSPNSHHVDPALFGTFLEKESNTISRASNEKARTLLGGLLSANNPSAPAEGGGTEEVMAPSQCIRELNHESAYDAVGLHPYAFKTVNHKVPQNRAQAESTALVVEENIRFVHNTLKNLGELGKQIWVTELGWPVLYGDTAHPAVSLEEQAELIIRTFDMIRANANELHVRSIFYFNDRDRPDFHHWDGGCGLREAIDVGPKWRPAVVAYEAEAGRPKWPTEPTAFTGNALPKARHATLHGRVGTEDVRTSYRFEYVTATEYEKETKHYEHPQTGPPQEAGYEGEVEAGSELTGLQPATKYHYRIVATNENGETKAGADQEFTTEPSTTIDTTIRTLNGETGWIDVSGHVNSSEGHTLTGDYVNINFWKNEGGQFVFKEKESTHAGITNNYYNLENWQIGKGEWKVQVVFKDFGEDLHSETPVHNITLENGYQLYNVNSGKCLEVANKSYSNGEGIHQWECGDPRTRQDQVFTLVPTGSGAFNYELVARHSNMCLDVIGAGQGPSTGVQQYECLGPGQTNQVWHGVPPVQNGNEPITFAALHSGQCLDVLSSATNNGANAVQNPCSGARSQEWVLIPVESNQVPLEAFITIEETLNGHPGYVTGHGNIKAGGYNLSGKWVNVNFQRLEPNGKYETVEDRTIHPTLSASGYYSFTYHALGAGEWQTRVVFPGEGPLEEDKSEYHPIHIGDGYGFKFRQSKMCLTTSENKTGNGTPIIQWDCGPSAGNGQVYSLVPVQPYGSSEFTIRPDTNTEMCVDVSGASTANGTYLQLWECLGEAQANQIWHIIPLAGQSEWFASIARHSGKCMDVLGQSLNHGARIDQWECWWGGNQQWQWLSIG